MGPPVHGLWRLQADPVPGEDPERRNIRLPCSTCSDLGAATPAPPKPGGMICTGGASVIDPELPGLVSLAATEGTPRDERYFERSRTPSDSGEFRFRNALASTDPGPARARWRMPYRRTLNPRRPAPSPRPVRPIAQAACTTSCQLDARGQAGIFRPAGDRPPRALCDVDSGRCVCSSTRTKCRARALQRALESIDACVALKAQSPNSRFLPDSLAACLRCITGTDTRAP